MVKEGEGKGVEVRRRESEKLFDNTGDVED